MADPRFKGVVREIDHGWNRLLQAVSLIKSANGGAVVKVGIIGEEAHADHGGISNVELGAVHEFGSPSRGIPERSYLRATADEKRPEHHELVRKLLAGVIQGRFTVEGALELLGQQVTADVKARIRAHIPPPLKTETIRRKGSSTPLIDKSQLINSITYEVQIGHSKG